MKSALWAKTLLTSYRYLEHIAGAIDKLVDSEAMNSYYYQPETKVNGVVEVSDRIISLIERKKRMINTKVLVDMALEKCNSVFAGLLRGKYFYHESCENLATKFNFPMRTFFRKMTQAESQLAFEIEKLGFTDEKLHSLHCEEVWMNEIYDKFAKGDEESIFRKPTDEEVAEEMRRRPLKDYRQKPERQRQAC